ncbi:MAG: hypothetical protein JKY65_09730 [Planctomycetes bacterium]|nr:hypothetical protein [Planctomycetota bacterium]
MTRWSLALAFLASLAVPLCAQEYSEAESWPSLEDPADRALDEALDRSLDEALDRSLDFDQPLERARRRPPPQPERDQQFMDYDKETIVRLEAFYLPVVGMHIDRNVRHLDRDWNVDPKTGSGLFLRLSGGDKASLGLSGHVSRHRERNLDTWFDAYAFYLDGQVGGALNEGPVEIVLYLGVGIGLAGFDFQDHFQDTVAAAAQIRLQGGLRILEHVELLANAAWFHWGYPGTSIGNGGYLGLGLSLRF